MNQQAIDQKVALTDEQQSIVESIFDNKRNTCITGPAGTGKSVLLRAIVNRAEELDRSVDIVGSTGIAAVNVGGQTLHSWAGMGLAQKDAHDIYQGLRYYKSSAIDRIEDCDILCVDEISMLDGSFLNKFDDLCRIIRMNQEPFGGIQVVFFGDFLQLPPVDKHAGFAFESAVWKNAEVDVRFLTKIFRQEDEALAQALSDIRLGRKTQRCGELLHSRLQRNNPPTPPGFDPVILHTHNQPADDINNDRLAELPGEIRSFEAIEWGKEHDRKSLKHLLAPQILNVKVGAKVMCLVNLDQDAGVVNGSVGYITDIRPVPGSDPTADPTRRYFIRVEFQNGIIKDIYPNEFKIEDKDTVIAKRTQFPLRLAYAISVHKSQGMTLPHVLVHLNRCFVPGQAYVALSRAKTIEGLVIASIHEKVIRAHPKALVFYLQAERKLNA